MKDLDTFDYITDRAAFSCMAYLNFTLSYLNFIYLTHHIAPLHPDSPCITQDSPSITLIYLVSPCLTKFHSILLKILHE